MTQKHRSLQETCSVRYSASRSSAVFILFLAGLFCLGFPLKGKAPPRQGDDFQQPQFAARPAPKGLNLVDLGKSDPRLKGFTAPEGVKVEIVAEAPAVINPVAMTFGEDGTPLVIEWLPSPEDWKETPVEFTHKDGSKRKVATVRKGVKDVIKVLEDSKKNGLYDKAKVILEEELPSTILLHDGWLYTASRGSVRRHKQSKEGGPYDAREVIAQGFGGLRHQQVSGLTLGMDGWLYISAGAGDHHVEGSDGSRATVLRTGAIFRCKPDGSKMETFALGFRNPYRDVAFDAASQMFHVDLGADDESKFAGCRLLHVAEGSDFGWRSRQGGRSEPDPVRAAVFGELPGKVPALLKTGRGSPAGLFIYNDTFFPEQYRGLLFYPDALRQLIRAYKVERNGAGFTVVEEFEFLKSDDPLFRPCQMVVGPDGAMYVVDRRTDAAGLSKPWGDGKNGRIYRLSWGGTKEQEAIALRGRDSWAKIRKQSEEELLKTLRSENGSDRQLVKRGEKNRPELLKLLEDTEAPSAARLAALGALRSFWNEEVAKALKGRLIDLDPDVRRLSIEALGMHGEAKGTEAVGLLDDGELDVRRSAALALARTASPGIADTLVNALVANDTRDGVLLDGLVRAIEMLGKTGMERLVALFESGDKKLINLVAATFLRLRTRPAADVIPHLLKYPHLSVKQRSDLLRSYNNYLLDPPVSLAPVLDYLTKNADEGRVVKLAAIEVLGMEPASAKQMGKLVLDKKLSREEQPAIVEALRKHAAGGDAEAASLLAALMKP
jgi:quinoprotein glucose dehydrogenase